MNERNPAERIFLLGTKDEARLKNTFGEWDVTVLAGRQRDIQWTNLPSIRADGYFMDNAQRDPITGAKSPYDASGWAYIWENPHTTGFYVEVFASPSVAQNLCSYLSQTVKFSY